MTEYTSDPSFLKLLDQSKHDLLKLLKVAGDQNRLNILILLNKGESSFSDLVNNFNVSKTALVHHLNKLKEIGLIESEKRGSYHLTTMGFLFLETLVTYITKIDSFNQNTEKSWFTESEKEPFLNLDKRKEISKEPIYDSSWNSYIASVSGVLSSLGVNCDYIQVAGRTGYCFVVNIEKGKTSYVDETAFTQEAWQKIYEGTESFGWKIHEWKQPKIYKDYFTKTGEDYEQSKEMFEAIRNVIDEKDTPVIVWGLRLPTYGIVKGYTKDSYLVSTYYRREGLKDTSIRFDSLYVLEYFKFFYFTQDPNLGKGSFIEDKKSIERAITLARGENVAREGFIAGPNAFSEWADILDSQNQSAIKPIGNSFLGRFYYDAKNSATEYLERVARRFSRHPQNQFLIDASKEYRRIKSMLEEFLLLFPYYNQKENKINEFNCKKGASLLRKAKKHEIQAVEELELAWENWT